MDFATYYEELKSCSSEMLRERADNEEYTEEYRKACEKILQERENGAEQEPPLKEDITEEEPLYDLEREVPASFEECYKADKVSEALYALSEKVSTWGTALLVILILAGVVISIMSGLATTTSTAETLYEQYEITEEAFDVGNFFTNILSWSIYAIVEYALCKFISLLLTALGSIVQSNRITSNIALYNASKDK